MDYATLGRTGLRVSVAGLGRGGFSCLGLNAGLGEDHAIGIIRQALDLGVNVIDNCCRLRYRGDRGQGVTWDFTRKRGDLYQSVKTGRRQAVHGEKILESLDGSLKRLGVDHVDVFQLHAVPPAAPKRRIAMCGMSPGWTWCCLGPATRGTRAPTSPPS